MTKTYDFKNQDGKDVTIKAILEENNGSKRVRVWGGIASDKIGKGYNEIAKDFANENGIELNERLSNYNRIGITKSYVVYVK